MKNITIDDILSGKVSVKLIEEFSNKYNFYFEYNDGVISKIKIIKQ